MPGPKFVTPNNALINVLPDWADNSVSRVEVLDMDGDGECFVALFSGPQSHQRASDYANFLSMMRTEISGELCELLYCARASQETTE